MRMILSTGEMETEVQMANCMCQGETLSIVATCNNSRDKIGFDWMSTDDIRVPSALELETASFTHPTHVCRDGDRRDSPPHFLDIIL